MPRSVLAHRPGAARAAADPVGYAQAQALPLRQLTISDAALHRAVEALAGAYQPLSTGTAIDRAADKAAVSAAQQALDAVCPGATS